MIKLDNNYNITVDGTHGFNLNYSSDPVKKEVSTKKGKEIRDVTTTDVWYYPKLSMVLDKYYSLNISAASQKGLLEKVIQVEQNINNFSKVFAKKGKVFETK